MNVPSPSYPRPPRPGKSIVKCCKCKRETEVGLRVCEECFRSLNEDSSQDESKAILLQALKLSLMHIKKQSKLQDEEIIKYIETIIKIY